MFGMQFDWFEGSEELEIRERECRLKCLKFIELSAFCGSITNLDMATF